MENQSLMSENPVESWNKYVCAFHSGVAAKACRKSIEENIHDILCLMLIISHTVITSKRPRPSCSICGATGHTARAAKHKDKQVGVTNSSVHNIIESMICN